MNERFAALVVVGVVGVLALVLLFKAGPTGKVSTRICPDTTAPVISGERFLSELKGFQDAGYVCFFGYDGLTPCCAPSGKLSEYEYLATREIYETRPRFP